MAEKRWLTEDKLALIIGLFLFLLSMLNFSGIDLLGWGIKVNVWTSFSKALATATGSYKDLGGWGALFAGLVIVMTPLLIVYWIFRDRIHETMLAGAIKG